MTATSTLETGVPGRPVAVCLHGFLGDPEEWRPVAEMLAPQLHCLAPPLPGHDGQPPPASDLVGLADALWAGLAPFLPARFALIGYSLGGRLALALARQHPNRITALVLEGAHPGLKDAAARQARHRHDEAWAQRLETQPWLENLDAWYRQPVFADLDEARRQALIQRRARHHPDHLAATLRAGSLAGQPDLRPALRALTGPRYYIAGRHDTKFSTIADELAAEVPGLTVAKIAGVGHNCHAEAPAEVAAILQRIRIDECT
ncbi:MAG: 2-succinyl-6-hydroxy-2,4-cyclohexadiene-1-carboxylate synthase [Halorhodospira sp.]